MITNTKDILFLTLSISSAVLVFFLCWAIYYALSAIRDIKHITKSIREKVESILDEVEKIKNKTENAAETTAVLSKTAIDVVEYVKAYKEKKKNKGKKK